MELKAFREFLFLFCFIIYVTGILFDGVVSYSNFKARESYFLAYEHNKEIVGFLDEGKFPVYNFLQTFLLLNVPLYIYYLSLRYPNRFNGNVANVIFMLAALSLAVCGSMHMMGGLSWWAI